MIASETWEREKQRLDNILNSRQYKTVSYYRKNRSPGGGCAIIYDENKFRLTDKDIHVPDNLEAVWFVFTPVSNENQRFKVKRIAVGSIYVSPRSKFKTEVIEHIIETIHILRAKYNNEISFCIGGDFNRVDISEILDCYGGLKQVISVSTRNQATLEILLTDLHSLYHPPTTLPPLQVDVDKNGKDSDHNIVVFAPKSNIQFKEQITKRTIKTRPILDSQLNNFERDLANYPWAEVFHGRSVNEKVDHFHTFLRSQLDFYFPEKTTKISNLDRNWMSPHIKQIHRRMQREFFHHRKSLKYKKLKSKFKKMKRNAVKTFYSAFVSDLKLTDPGKWYQMAKKIGAIDQMSRGEVKVESLSELNNLEAARAIAAHFAAISNEYSPVDTSQLPCYLPAPPPPQVEEKDVYKRLCGLKKTRSTLPIDIPDKVRQECAIMLSVPLTTIINDSLKQSVYPSTWKQEWVTPVPKLSHPKQISDLRKISSTSDYSKLYEGFLKDWIMEDVSKNLDIGQFGGQPGIGTEHTHTHTQ